MEEDTINRNLPTVMLVGTGVVGRSILKAHCDAGVSVGIADQDEASLRLAIEELNLPDHQWSVGDLTLIGGNLPCVPLISVSDHESAHRIPLLIESIPERLDLKQDFFEAIEPFMDDRTVLCTNTSTLAITKIAQGLLRPQQFCGMHFFMPVDQRQAVELIRGKSTGDQVMATASDHLRRLGKAPLIVDDSPGFIVNRLLATYLNEALTLLCQGVSADALEQAAINYGMPMSPLELIDTIGTRTMFDAGRVYWQAFPQRMDPSPLIAGLVKSKRLGKQVGGGLFNYDDAGHRSPGLSEITMALIERYQISPVKLSADDLLDRLAIPMWIEAAIAHAEGTVEDAEQFDLAMRGGLGYAPNQSWRQFFDDLGSRHLLSAINQWSPTVKSMIAPPALVQQLEQNRPGAILKPTTPFSD